MINKTEPDGIVLSEAEMRSRRLRSIATGLLLGALVVLFFAITLIQGPAILNRPI